MTVRALLVASVVQRLVRQHSVHKSVRHPRHRRMAVVTILGRYKMSRVRTRCGRTIVARTAGTQYLVVVDIGGGRPGNRAVAVLANIRCQDVHRVFSDGVSTIMAARTIAHHRCMVKDGGQP